MTPLVSILIPAFNCERWIGDTVRSALAQTWERKEIIVVDDGSTDGTYESAQRFESPSVQVIRQNNQGAAAARNSALSLAKGDYIQWLDADDLLGSEKIALQMEARRKGCSETTLLAGPWGIFRHHPLRAHFTLTSLWRDLSPAEWLFLKLSENAYMQTSSWLVSRELTEAAGPWDTRLLSDDDGEYFCRVLMGSDEVRFVPGAKAYYRGSGVDSLSYIGTDKRKIDALWLSMKMHVGYLRKLEESPRVCAACVRYLRASLIYFYPERMDIVEEARQLSAQLGEDLGLPQLSWKYSWLLPLVGFGNVKAVQRTLRVIRARCESQVQSFLPKNQRFQSDVAGAGTRTDFDWM